MKLYYSGYDGGYYWQRLSDWKTSQIFKTTFDANVARKSNKLKWD